MTNVNVSVEFDINTNPIGLRSEEFDMSITDTVHNHNLEEVLHNYKSTKNDRKSNMDDDWTLDKENIVVNPYVAPKESVNFAINEVPDQVLVFDGKRLTIQSEHKNPFDHNREENDFNKTLLPNEISDRPPQRKTIVLNLNDVPAASGVTSVGKNITMSNEQQQRQNEINFQTNKSDLSNLRKTIIYDSSDIANISVTQAIITNILLEKEKRKTIVFENDNGDLSMTQALPSNVLAASKIVPQNKTVLYDVDNISITQAVPTNLLLLNKSVTTSKSVATSQSDFDLSFTQAIPNNMLLSNKSNGSNKRNTIVFDNDKADISITRVLPSNILISDIIKNNIPNENADVQNVSEIISATKENVISRNKEVEDYHVKVITLSPICQ
ncbi:hypothetical protein RR48_00909 [Papilio machaon]|uniref:Uncharacterized protein n=1 Tax=Papilio machaon TaxID=76193 RepID=A0A0N0PDN9_PAPMA|nr:hypothetical protein RR48_00909 [Papilio machaon]